MTYKIDPKIVLRNFLYVIIFLLIINLIGVISFNHFDFDYFLRPLFDFDTERNIPTLYSSIALFFCSVLLTSIASLYKRIDKTYMYWLGLAVIFLFLSIDEIASIHEKLTNPTRELLHTDETGMFRFAWIIPYSIVLVIFLLSYLKFLYNLPRKIGYLFVLSGGIFVIGALGLESLGGLPIFRSNKLIYSLLLTSEEFLEMLGIVVFIYTLLYFITIEFGDISIRLGNSNSNDG